MDEAFRENLRKLITGKILFDEPADRHTSIGVGGRIDALVFPETEEELVAAAGLLRASWIPFLPVGNWTNLIVTDTGYRGALLSLASLRGLKHRSSGDGDVLLTAEAGVSLAELVNLSAHEALTGMEFCAGIPGSVGGAIRMNAGAYGGEMKDIAILVRLFVPGEGIRTMLREALHFSYRNLDLPAESIIIGAEFRLRRGDGKIIADKIKEINGLRRGKHPLEFRNAGSIFKNPRLMPAGRLIEEAGLKGIRIGDAQISEKHGNFIVNRGKATAEEILRLMALVQQRVFEARGYNLEPEVRIIGE